MKRLIMLFLFQGCLRLSFKNLTGLSCGLTMDRIAGLQDYKIYRIDCFGLAVG